MSKRKRNNSSDSKIEKWIKEGRGQGEGSSYKPWLNIQDVASYGYATRDLGWKTKRIHHFLSQLELHYMYTLEWSPSVIDIREQYPLLPLERTLEIAEDLGIEHPRENGKHGPFKVITTDFFLITQNESGLKTVVRSIKPVNNLDVRELEKFDIEKRYFHENGIDDWGIVTDADIPKGFIHNFEWIYDSKSLNNRPNLNLELIRKLEPQIYKGILNEQMGLSELALKFDEKFGLEYGTCLFIIKYLLANKIWNTDMNKLINPSEKLELLNKSEDALNNLIGGA